ncbi:MAG: hypothetical protein QNJ15_01585 [Erythrobacter sp.]|nr:hypothetical protein [Erythrobacter sp.]
MSLAEKIRKNPIFALLALIGVVIAGVSTFADNIVNLVEIIGGHGEVTSSAHANDKDEKIAYITGNCDPDRQSFIVDVTVQNSTEKPIRIRDFDVKIDELRQFVDDGSYMIEAYGTAPKGQFVGCLSDGVGNYRFSYADKDRFVFLEPGGIMGLQIEITANQTGLYSGVISANYVIEGKVKTEMVESFSEIALITEMKF